MFSPSFIEIGPLFLALMPLTHTHTDRHTDSTRKRWPLFRGPTDKRAVKDGPLKPEESGNPEYANELALFSIERNVGSHRKFHAPTSIRCSVLSMLLLKKCGNPEYAN